jgi:hypothetical protein
LESIIPEQPAYGSVIWEENKSETSKRASKQTIKLATLSAVRRAKEIYILWTCTYMKKFKHDPGRSIEREIREESIY